MCIRDRRVSKPKPDLSNFNQSVKSGNRIFNRKFKKDSCNKYSWLRGCFTQIAVFCFPCVLFGEEETWTFSIQRIKQFYSIPPICSPQMFQLLAATVILCLLWLTESCIVRIHGLYILSLVLNCRVCLLYTSRCV